MSMMYISATMKRILFSLILILRIILEQPKNLRLKLKICFQVLLITGVSMRYSPTVHCGKVKSGVLQLKMLACLTTWRQLRITGFSKTIRAVLVISQVIAK